MTDPDLEYDLYFIYDFSWYKRGACKSEDPCLNIWEKPMKAQLFITAASSKEEAYDFFEKKECYFHDWIVLKEELIEDKNTIIIG